MQNYKVELASSQDVETVEFKSDKTGIALVRQAKKEIGNN